MEHFSMDEDVNYHLQFIIFIFPLCVL
uniref:Uncharacterized protein n=1 Tax=Rhizophora mucronata TaxID=61149 RepID=A0A2P2QDN7_RHIMU